MIRGIGVDSACISEISRYRSLMPAFVEHTFTEGERALAPEEHGSRAVDEFFAVRFAAKEAVFKAVGHLAPGQIFDFRKVETLRHSDGAPYVNIDDFLKPILDAADIDVLHIAATTEGDLATVFVVAEKL